MRAAPAMINATVCVRLGQELAAEYEARLPPMPLRLIEWMAHFAVAEAMAEFDQLRQPST